jgi:hypothetical protein
MYTPGTDAPGKILEENLKWIKFKSSALAYLSCCTPLSKSLLPKTWSEGLTVLNHQHSVIEIAGDMQQSSCRIAACQRCVILRRQIVPSFLHCFGLEGDESKPNKFVAYGCQRSE